MGLRGLSNLVALLLPRKGYPSSDSLNQRAASPSHTPLIASFLMVALAFLSSTPRVQLPKWRRSLGPQVVLAQPLHGQTDLLLPQRLGWPTSHTRPVRLALFRAHGSQELEPHCRGGHKRSSDHCKRLRHRVRYGFWPHAGKIDSPLVSGGLRAGSKADFPLGSALRSLRQRCETLKSGTWSEGSDCLKTLPVAPQRLPSQG